MSRAQWWRQETSMGAVHVVVAEAGVRRVTLPGAAFTPPPGAIEARDEQIATQIDEYFAGERQTFEFDVDLSTVSGAYARGVLETLAADVAFGETVTYGELAGMTGSPRAARAVGNAMRHNPVPIVVPCHRVLGRYGLGGFGNRPELKRQLLALEGVEV